MKYYYCKYNGLRNDKFYFNNIRNQSQVYLENKPSLSLLPTEILGGLYETHELAKSFEMKHKAKYEFIIGEYYLEYGYKVVMEKIRGRITYKLYDMELGIVGGTEFNDMKEIPTTHMGKCVQIKPRYILLGYTLTTTHRMKRV